MDVLQEILQSHWGHTAFRPLQREIIETVLRDRDVLAVLPTGGGKSICYQIPALAIQGLALVVSPLIALMEDQVQHLLAHAIPAAALHSGLSREAIEKCLQEAESGRLRVLYLSPERLASESFAEQLPQIRPALIAIDEAHCISQWGHSFRPDYLHLSRLRYHFPGVPFLALTGSATREVLGDIRKHLKLLKPAFYRQSVDRPNLCWQISECDTKLTAAIQQLQNLPSGSAIVYCRSRRQTETLVRQLSLYGIACKAYHAGMNAADRGRIQNEWMDNLFPVMVATTAFGMGIDKPDVRMVLHYDLPDNPESYYQEAGRAGRDGQPATALMLYQAKDLQQLEDSLFQQFPKEDYLKQVYQAVADYLQIPIGAEPFRYYAFPVAEFCQRFKLDPLPAYNALKLLAQEGLWTLTEAVFRMSSVQFTTFPAVLEQLEKFHPEESKVAKALLRLYAGIFVQHIYIKEADLARKTGLGVADLRKNLLLLHHMQIIDYQPAAEKPELFFKHRRVDSQHLLLDRERIHQLRERKRVRIEAMKAMITQTETCRAVILRAYFSEDDTTPCGCCDICLRKNAATLSPQKMRKQVLALLAEGALSYEMLLQKLLPATSDAVQKELRFLVEEGFIMYRKDSGFRLRKA